MLIRLHSLLRRFHGDRSGLALLEFALSMPLVLALGCYGVELSNLALVNMRISHATIDLADNTARMGTQDASSGNQTLTENDIDNTIQALRLETNSLGLTSSGRVTISSLEAVTDSKGNTTQWLHWQRCVGTNSTAAYAASVAAPTDDSGVTIAGLGTAPQLTAPPGSSLMYVEVNYTYHPLMAAFLVGPRQIHYVSAMIVRATRSPSDAITNPATPPSTKMTCNLYTT